MTTDKSAMTTTSDTVRREGCTSDPAIIEATRLRIEAMCRARRVTSPNP